MVRSGIPPTVSVAFVVCTTALVTASLAGPVAGLAHEGEGDTEAEIRPGTRVTDPTRCTLNWVFDDTDGNVYVGTAAHCVDHVGQPVHVAGIEPRIGVVAYQAGGFGFPDDFALVKVDEALEDRVNPITRGTGGPLGMFRPAPISEPQTDQDLLEAPTPATADDELARELPTPGDGDGQPSPLPVVFHGHGVGWGDDEDTRTRAGLMESVSERRFTFVGPITGGDSGGPVQAAGAGLAVGPVAGNAGVLYGVEPGTPGPLDQRVTGPLLVESLADAEEELDATLSLRTVFDTVA